MDPYLTGGWAAPGWAGVGGEARVLSCRFGGRLRRPGGRVSKKTVKALSVYRLIFLGAVAAILDLLHYPPPGAEPGSGISGQSLVGFPRTLAFG